MRALGTCSNAEISPGSSNPEDKPTQHTTGRLGAFLRWETRSGINPHLCAALVIQRQWKMWRLFPGVGNSEVRTWLPPSVPLLAGALAHPSTLPSCTLTLRKDPSCAWFHPGSEEGGAARRPAFIRTRDSTCLRHRHSQEPGLFLLSSLFCCLLLTFKCMAFFPLEIFRLLMVHSKKILPQALAFAFNFGVLRC